MQNGGFFCAHSEMAARYFLFHFTFITSCLVAGQSSKYELKGGTVLLEPNIAGHPDGILWKYNGNKVVEFNGKEEEVFNPYKNRVTLDWVSAELVIADLRFEDSGEYELEVDVNKRLHRSLYNLEVIDKVAKPTISCELNDGGSSNTSGKLVCSAESGRPQSFMTFEWRTHGSVLPGPQLQIPLRDQHDEEVYSCNVSNLLSSEEATFTAKDCYPDESSSVILIVSLVIPIVCLLVCLAVLFCKLRHKACFAKHDLENQSPPGRTEGSDRKKAPDDEKRPLVHRESTLPSTQPLGRFQGNRNMRPDEPASNQKEDTDSDHDTVKEHENNEQDDKPAKGHVKNAIEKLGLTSPKDQYKKTEFFPHSGLPSSPDQNNLPCSDKGDADAGQRRESLEEKVPQSDPSDAEKENEPDPADDLEPEKEEDEKEEGQSAPADVETSPAAQPPSLLTVSSPNVAPKDTAGEHEEVANSDGVPGDSGSSGEEDGKEEDGKEEDGKEEDGKEEDGKEENGKESDGKESDGKEEDGKEEFGKEEDGKEEDGKEEVRKEEDGKEEDGKEEDGEESDDSSEDKQLSTDPERRVSETFPHEQDLYLSQEETNTSLDKEQETVKPVSEDKDQHKTDSVGEHEETDRDLYSANSQKPQSPTPTKPDNSNTDTCQEPPDAAHAPPEEEEEYKSCTDSDETEGQSDKGEGQTVEDENEVQCGLKGETQGNESCSGDEAGQNKDEVAA